MGNKKYYLPSKSVSRSLQKDNALFFRENLFDPTGSVMFTSNKDSNVSAERLGVDVDGTNMGTQIVGNFCTDFNSPKHDSPDSNLASYLLSIVESSLDISKNNRNTNMHSG